MLFATERIVVVLALRDFLEFVPPSTERVRVDHAVVECIPQSAAPHAVDVIGEALVAGGDTGRLFADCRGRRAALLRLGRRPGMT